MVWFWLFCTLWARRHNYLHITKLSQTAAARNQQVSVNDKRCLSKRKRISQLAAAAALQTSRSGWIWEPATTLWRSGFSSSSDHLGIIISRFPTCPPACCPINDDQLWGMVRPAYPALCPLCVRLIYYATLWSGIPPLRRIMWFLIKCFQHSLLLGKLIIDPPCDYFELTSLTENYLLEHNIIIQPCCSVPPPSTWSLTVFALITPHHTPSSWRQNSTGTKTWLCRSNPRRVLNQYATVLFGSS